MSSTRNVISPPPFAANALTDIPPTPVAGVSYRDPIAGPASSLDGWPYAERVNSAEWNQIMYQISTLVSIMDKKGILGWSDAVDYSEAGMAFGSDGIPYVWLQPSGPALGGAKDPAAGANPTYWRAFATISTDGISGSALNLKGSCTGTTAPVTVTADSVCVKNAAREQKVLNSVSISPSLAVSGVNGLDTGVSAASTWYYVWVIWDGTTIAGLISLSSTAPTMPAGYTHKARVSEFRTDSTANKFPLKFKQEDNSFQWVLGGNTTNLPVLAQGTAGNISGSPATWAPAPVAAAVPPNAIAITLFIGNSNGALGVTIGAPNNLFGGFGGNPSCPLMIAGGASTPASTPARFVLEGPNVYYASAVPGATMNCIGWESDL